MKPKSLRSWEPVVLAIAFFYPFVLTLVYFVLLAGSEGTLQKLAFWSGKTVQFLLPILWTGVLLRERWRIRSFRKVGVFQGVLFGSAVFLAMFLMYHFYLKSPGGYLASDSRAVGIILDRVKAFQIMTLPMFLVFWAFYLVVHSGLEEYYWRWFIFRRMKSRISPGKAILLSSFGFMLHHYLLCGTYFGYMSPFAWFCTLSVGIGGVYWAWSYQRFDSIWPAWISHGIIDAAIFGIGYYILF